MTDLEKERLIQAKKIGERIVETLNFSVFNARPKPQKIAQVYGALKERKYVMRDANDTRERITQFFLKRTRTAAAQAKLFFDLFKVKLDSAMLEHLGMEFWQAEIDPTTIEFVGKQVYRLFDETLDEDQAPLFSERQVIDAMKSMYRCSYDRRVRSFGYDDLEYAILSELRRSDEPQDLSRVRKQLEAPNPEIPLREAEEKLEEDEESQDGVVGGGEKDTKTTDKPELPPAAFSGTDEQNITLPSSQAKLEETITQAEWEWLKLVVDQALLKQVSNFPLPKGTKQDGHHPEVRNVLKAVNYYNVRINRDSPFGSKFTEIQALEYRRPVGLIAKRVLDTFEEGRKLKTIHSIAS